MFSTGPRAWHLATPGNPIPNQLCPGGGTAQIAGLAAPGGNQFSVGQFFPEHTPAANISDDPA
jgi:hypothetical protein